MSERVIEFERCGDRWRAVGRAPCHDGVIEYTTSVASHLMSYGPGESFSVSVTAETPWEASAIVHDMIGPCQIIWETLPWPERRLAIGIVAGIAELFGAAKGAQRAIDLACYSQEMRELGVSEYRLLDPLKRAQAAARAAERFCRLAVDESNADAARTTLKWVCVAADWLDGYLPAKTWIVSALAVGFPNACSAMMTEALDALRWANERNDIVPDSCR